MGAGGVRITELFTLCDNEFQALIDFFGLIYLFGTKRYNIHYTVS